MPSLTVVIPTISGREESLARAIASYEDTLQGGPSYEIIQIKDWPTWPSACNEGYKRSKGDILHFTADDLEALPGWWERPLEHLAEYNELPAPRVYDYRPDGRFANEDDGPDGALTHFTRIPIMTREQYDTIGLWPHIDYYADLWLSEKARSIGIKTRMVFGYDFVHHWSQIGRVDSQENLQKAAWELDRLRRETFQYRPFKREKV
jgi:glycosyltransferase involved in cell wall biosynthesis